MEGHEARGGPGAAGGRMGPDVAQVDALAAAIRPGQIGPSPIEHVVQHVRRLEPAGPRAGAQDVQQVARTRRALRRRAPAGAAARGRDRRSSEARPASPVSGLSADTCSAAPSRSSETATSPAASVAPGRRALGGKEPVGEQPEACHRQSLRAAGRRAGGRIDVAPVRPGAGVEQDAGDHEIDPGSRALVGVEPAEGARPARRGGRGRRRRSGASGCAAGRRRSG